MESLETGRSPVRTFRINAALWSGLEDWAARSGVGNGEALRELLRIGLEAAPPWPPSKPLLEYMRAADPAGVFARVKPGESWYDLDDALLSLPGAQRLTLDPRGYKLPRPVVQLPRGSMPLLQEAFAGRANRLVVHCDQ